MKLLIVAPHPDDEAIGCGGLVSLNIKAGNQVLVLFLTSGEHGCPGMDVEKAASIREHEGILASTILGSTIYDFWRHPDGSLTYTDEIRDRMVYLISKCEPDVVYVTHERESHPDHRAAGKIVREALQKMENPPECLTYEVWTPHTRAERIVDITEAMDNKVKAIRAHASQVERQSFDEAAIGLSRYRGVMNGRCMYAEAFCKMRSSGESFMKVALVLMTYSPSPESPRSKYAKITLESTLDNLSVGDNELHIHIADDGSYAGHVEGLIEIANSRGYSDISVTNSNRRGYGGSYNLATQVLHGDYDLIFPLEDDWQLLKPLNLEPLINAIDQSNGEIRCIRLGYIGFTGELKGKIVYHADQLFLLFDPESSEHHVFAGHPRLETVEFERDVGPWPENISAGNVEWEVTHRWPARVGVTWPLDLGIPAGQVAGNMYGHIGTDSIGGLVPEGVHIV